MISIILLVFVCLLIFLYAVDFFHYLINRFCRYHIGRMNVSEWEEAVYKKALKWKKHPPIVKKSDNSRYIFIDIITGNYKSDSIQAFQTAALLLGIEEMDEEDISSLFLDNNKWKKKPTKPDVAMLAYAILKSADNPMSIKSSMDEVYSLLQNSTDEMGIISYTGDKTNTARYVDALGMVCPFLVKYGIDYNIPDAIKQAYEQLCFFYKFGMYPGTVLPNHAVHIHSKLPLGVYGWGRGTGWYVIGLLDTYNEMPACEYKDSIEKMILEAAECYKVFQYSDGGFGCILPRDNRYDSSVTAVMAWFYLECSDIFNNQEYETIAIKALEKLRSVTRRNGAIDWSQGDTKEIGVFSQTFDIMPFTQGFALRAIALTRRKKNERTQQN